MYRLQYGCPEEMNPSMFEFRKKKSWSEMEEQRYPMCLSVSSVDLLPGNLFLVSIFSRICVLYIKIRRISLLAALENDGTASRHLLKLLLLPLKHPFHQLEIGPQVVFVFAFLVVVRLK